MDTNAAAPPSRNRVSRLIADHPITAYFVIAYLGSWIVLAQFVLSADGSGLFAFHATYSLNTSIAIGVLTGPALGAIVVTCLTRGEAGLIAFLKRLVHWRVGVRWWVFALVAFPIATTIGCLLVPGVAGSYTPDGLLPGLTGYLPFFIYPALLAGGPLFEEVGWRGAGQPLLQQRFNPLKATLLLGPLWALWHAPIWISGEWSRPTALNILTFILWICAATFIYTWFFNKTGGSILMAIVLHGTMDVFPNKILFAVLPSVADYTSFGVLKMYLGILIGFGALAIILVIATKGRLGLAPGATTPGAEG